MTASPIRETVAKIIAAERKAPVERLEDVLSRIMGYRMIDPHRQLRPVETEAVRSPRPRECPERPNKASRND